MRDATPVQGQGSYGLRIDADYHVADGSWTLRTGVARPGEGWGPLTSEHVRSADRSWAIPNAILGDLNLVEIMAASDEVPF